MMPRLLPQALLFTLGVATLDAAAQQPAQTAGQRYASVKVLRDIPSDQIIPSMAFIANALGVTCAHCHTADWASDALPNKDKARAMMRLTEAINRDHFSGQRVVTCQTCHDGRVVPAATPRIEDAGWLRVRAATAAAPALPPVETVMSAYLRAVNGAADLASLKNRSVSGTVTRFNGRTDPASGPFTLFQQQPSTARLSTELSHPPEADVEVSVSFVRPLMTARIYSDLNVIAIERLRDRDAYVVAGKNSRGIEHRMYFDVATGLLLRRANEIQTPLGPLPERFDFDDYRRIDGVMVPHRIEWSRADYQVTFQFTSVAHNVAEPK